MIRPAINQSRSDLFHICPHQPNPRERSGECRGHHALCPPEARHPNSLRRRTKPLSSAPLQPARTKNRTSKKSQSNSLFSGSGQGISQICIDYRAGRVTARRAKHARRRTSFKIDLRSIIERVRTTGSAPRQSYQLSPYIPKRDCTPQPLLLSATHSLSTDFPYTARCGRSVFPFSKKHLIASGSLCNSSPFLLHFSSIALSLSYHQSLKHKKRQGRKPLPHPSAVSGIFFYLSSRK